MSLTLLPGLNLLKGRRKNTKIFSPIVADFILGVVFSTLPKMLKSSLNSLNMPKTLVNSTEIKNLKNFGEAYLLKILKKQWK